MSGADVTMLLNTQYGNLSALFASKQTLWSNRGYDTTNIFATDNTYFATGVGNEANFGQQQRFRIRKRGGRVHKAWLRVYITPGQINPAAFDAAYVDDLAAAIIENARISYASKVLQEYNGEALKAYKRLMSHDIDREAYYAQAFGNLPPGGAFEAIRQANVAVAAPAIPVPESFILYVPLDWFYFTRCEDYACVPEALSSEIDLEIRYRPLQNVVYARTVPGGVTPVVNPFAIQPTIVRSELFQQLIHVPVPEKNSNLRTYELEQGNLFKILDFEEQLNNVLPATAGVENIRLDNMRLDSQFIMFFVRDIAKDTPWAIDAMQSDTAATALTGGLAVNGLQPITSFRLVANGRVIVDTCTDIENRAVWRNIYFPGSQIAEPIYFIPFGWLLRDHKNIASFQNLANLGNIMLELTLPVSPNGRQRVCDAYSVAHNIVQWKRGDVVKALR